MTTATQTEVEVPSHLVNVRDRVLAEEAEFTLPEDRAYLDAHPDGKLDFFLTGQMSVIAETFLNSLNRHPRHSTERRAAIREMRERLELLEFSEAV